MIFPVSCDLLRASLYAIISPFSTRSVKLHTLMSAWAGTNCSTEWTWYRWSGTVYRGDTMGTGPEPRGTCRRALMTDMAVKINGPDTTRKAKLDGVLRNCGEHSCQSSGWTSENIQHQNFSLSRIKIVRRRLETLRSAPVKLNCECCLTVC